jgi:anti-anti-sigma factor
VQDGLFPLQLDVHVDPEGVAAVVAVRGEIDLFTCAGLRAAILAPLRSGLHVTVDLAEVSFMDAAGVGELLAAKHEAALLALRLSLRNAAGIVRRVLELTGTDKLFED